MQIAAGSTWPESGRAMVSERTVELRHAVAGLGQKEMNAAKCCTAARITLFQSNRNAGRARPGMAKPAWHHPIQFNGYRLTALPEKSRKSA